MSRKLSNPRTQIDELKVATFYKFVALSDCDELQVALLSQCLEQCIRGTIVLAPEGINGTIAGKGCDVDALIMFLREGVPLAGRLGDLEVKLSYTTTRPFHRMKVRLKREIVTLRAPEADPTRHVGTYVAAQEWNALISEPDVMLLDTRNDYEVAMGSFAGAIDPKTSSFADFKRFVGEKMDSARDTRIATFCTGGIRCEKATAYLIARGFENVYHLKGGILSYLKAVPEQESFWHGACFVFDERVGVGHGLAETDHRLCRACRRPLSSAEMTRADFIDGVQCHWCKDEGSAERRLRAAERQRQVVLAETRGRAHLGLDAALEAKAARHKKQRS